MPGKVKTTADFKDKHDRNVIVPRKIRVTLDAMAKEAPDCWEYEGDFIKRAGLSQTDMGAFRDQFKDHYVQLSGGKRVWVATIKAAAKFRETVGAAGV